MKNLSKQFVEHSDANIPIAWWLREKRYDKYAVNCYIGAFGDRFHPMYCYWDNGVVLGFEI